MPFPLCPIYHLSPEISLGSPAEGLLIFLLLEFPIGRFIPFSGFEADGMSRTCLNTRGTGEAIGNHPFSFEDGIHHGRGARLCTGFAGDAGLIIDLNFKEAYLLNDPPCQAKRTEEVTPGPVDKERSDRKGANKDTSRQDDLARIKCFEGIDEFHEVHLPEKSDQGKRGQKNHPDRIRKDERRFKLLEDSLSVL